MWSVLALIGVNIFARMTVPAAGLFLIPVVIYQLYAVYKLGTAARLGGYTWLVLILTFIPLLGLLAIVMMVTRINRLFKERSLPVGFMGPDVSKIPVSPLPASNTPSLPPTE